MAEHSEDDPIVCVPGGPRRRSSIRQIEHGHCLDTSSGRILKRHTASGRIIDDFGATPSDERGVPQVIQWIVFATWNPSVRQPITSFKTTWIVPPAPKTQNTQLVYLFNGLQSSSWIYQPVLQWGFDSDTLGDGGGYHWSVATWLVGGANGPAFFSPLTKVNTGDTLTGAMTMIGKRTVGTSTVFDWDCVFEGIPGTCFPVRGVPLFNNAVETLEAYDSTRNLPPTNCSDYPFVLKTSMIDIEIKSGEEVLPIPWQAVNRIIKCGQNCVVSSSGKQVDLNYFSPPAPGPPELPFRVGDGEGLEVTQSLTSNDGRFTLVLQTDGNLVLYGPEQQALWASNTAGHLEIWSVTLQSGALVLRDVLNNVFWTSGSSSPGGDTLDLLDNGNMLITRAGGQVWASNTVVPDAPLQSTAIGQLFEGEGLQPGANITSTNNEFAFTLQTDGNLVLYGPQKQPMWASNTAGDPATWSLVMQNDGNLVIYDIHNNPRWASNTDGHPGASLTVQDDGNAVIYDGGSPIWATNTVVPSLPSLPPSTSDQCVAGQGLVPGSSVKSSDGRFTFTLQSDGNVVLYGPQNQPLWASNTAGHTNIWSLFMQNDGNLVAYDTHNGVIWSSNTQGHDGAYVVVQDDGNVVIYNVNDTSIWATNTVVPSEPGPPSASDRISIDEGITAGSSLTSSNGDFTLTLQLDGNLVLYGPSPCFAVLWASNTAGHSNVWDLVMQSDGNLVAYDGHSNAFFATNTVGEGGDYVVVQNDGNVVMYNAAGTQSFWSSGTNMPAVPAQPLSPNGLNEDEGIIAGQTLTSPSGKYTFSLLINANIGLFGPGVFNPASPSPTVWQSNTVGYPTYPWFLVMQGDGNLVAYDSEGKSYWASNTAGSGGAVMAVLDTGHVQIADASGNVVWHEP